MRYYNIHLGRSNTYASLGVKDGFIGLDHGMPDLSSLSQEDQGLKDKLKDIYNKTHHGPDSSVRKTASAVGNIYRLLSTFQLGDRVLTAMGDGTYQVGEIIGYYQYAGEGEPIPHRRPIRWFATLVKENLSQSLKYTLGSIGAISDITSNSQEIEAYLSGDTLRIVEVQTSLDEQEFALEAHLEEFLIKNWTSTELGRDYELLRDDEGEIISKQYSTEVGPIDILAVKKDQSELLVIELKKGRSGDAVVGQLLRYITAVKKEIAEMNQTVKGIIITGADDKKIRYAIEPLQGLVSFSTYKVSFKLENIQQ